MHVENPGSGSHMILFLMLQSLTQMAKIIKPGYFTVFHNGVLIQNHVEIFGTTTNVGQPEYTAHG